MSTEFSFAVPVLIMMAKSSASDKFSAPYRVYVIFSSLYMTGKNKRGTPLIKFVKESGEKPFTFFIVKKIP